MEELFRLLREALLSGMDGVVVTVTAKTGSVPRGAGARMLVTRGGRASGTIGGGVLEHQAEKMAEEILQTKHSRTECFTLRPNQIRDLGMICGGDVNIHFQYLSPGDENNLVLMDKISALYQTREEFWLINRLSGKGGISVYTAREGLIGQPVPQEVWAGLAEGTIQKETRGESYFCEKMIPAGKVYIFGGGHVSQALVPALCAVDFRCIILEDRREFCRRELFPGAEEILLIETSHIADYVDIGGQDYVCIMTRGHKDDLAVQAQVLKTDAAYIGVIGSRTKKAGVFKKLKEMHFTDKDLERIITPIGLSIKAETPAEIAVSITAQLIQERAQRKEGKGFSDL